MPEIPEKKVSKSFNRTDHSANERTFLAWIRTNLGIMAFGFVVERFTFFLKQLSQVAGKAMPLQTPEEMAYQSYSSIFGIFLIGVGTILCIFAYFKYKRTEQEIMDEVFRPSTRLEKFLTIFMVLVGIFLIIYLAAYTVR